MKAVLRHGILRERLADLLTDTFRAQLLRILGYRVKIMEFVSHDATAKNLLLRAEYGVAPGQGDAVASWVGMGENKPVSSNQIQQALGSEQVQALAAKLGVAFRVDIERRIAGAEKVGKHKTSMLQDVESGRDPEIDALVGAVIELGNRVGVPVPHIEAVYAMVKLLGRTMKEEKLYIKGHPIP